MFHATPRASATGHGQVLAHDAGRCPPLPAPGPLRPGLGHPAGVLPPHMRTAGAPVAAHRDLQRRGPPPRRLVCQPPHHVAARHALAAAAAAPLVRLDDPARQNGTLRLDALPDNLQAELVQARVRGQARAVEGSVEHVGAFQMGSVRTSILGGPYPYPATATPTTPTPSSVKSRQ